MARQGAPPINLNQGLPTNFAAALGRVIARHSYLELFLSTCLYRMLGVTDAVGRIAIGTPRGSEILDRMLQLGKTEGLEFQPFQWDEFRTILNEVKRDRDIFAHSAWIYHTKARRYFLYVTRGKTATQRNAPSNDRRLFPEGVPASLLALRTLRKKIEKAIRQAEALDRIVQHSLRSHENALRRKFPSPTAPDHRSQGRK